MPFLYKFIIIIASILISAVIVRAAFSIIVGSKPTIQSAIRASALKKFIFFFVGGAVGLGLAVAKDNGIPMASLVPIVALLMMGVVFALYVKTLDFDSRPSNRRIALIALIEGVFLASSTIYLIDPHQIRNLDIKSAAITNENKIIETEETTEIQPSNKPFSFVSLPSSLNSTLP